MSLIKVGFDLDNTIIDYSESMKILSKEFLGNTLESKEQVKEYLLLDELWQNFQGILYTKGLDDAKVMEGFIEIFNWLRGKGHKVYILSHKTKHPHNNTNVNLRDLALNWLKENRIICRNFPKSNIFFYENQKDKIIGINSFGLDYYFDDLDEIINNKKLKVKNKILVKNRIDFLQIKEFKDYLNYNAK
jgi:phosphoglycolate phosphatase-like HAD superfamily hydrolase